MVRGIGMLKKDFRAANLEKELKAKIKTVLKNTLTQDQYNQITEAWEALKKSHPEGRCDYATMQKYWVLQEQLANSSLFLQTRPEYALALKYLGYSDQDIEEELRQSQNEIDKNAKLNNPFEEYGIQIIRVEKGKSQFTIEPFTVFQYDTDVTVDLGFSLEDLDKMDLEIIQ